MCLSVKHRIKLFRRLTKREIEVLHWVSAGKTYWEISVIFE
ncbi:LuxR C-terminal-related transcriptional regulator [Arsenophonus nasoniae]